MSECRELCDERKEKNLERGLKELVGGMGVYVFSRVRAKTCLN